MRRPDTHTHPRQPLMLAALLKKSLKNLAVTAAAQFGPQRWPGRESRLWVLMYHRILPLEDDRARTEEPGMIVAPDTFAMHLRELGRHFQFVQLDDWLTARAAGAALPARACAVTFDDGWRDNYEFAWPILRQQQVPATIFLVSDMIGTTAAFWPNRLARLLHAAGDGWQRHPALAWLPATAGTIPGASFRENLALCVARCKALPETELLAHIARSEQQLAILPGDTPADLMDWAQIGEMAGSGLVHFGSHTRNHMRLLPGAEEVHLLDEIIGSKSVLEQRLQRPVELFCYPNGDASALARSTVEKHYRGAVTTARGINDRKTPAAALFRVGLHQDVSDTPAKLLARLSCWV